MYRLSIAMVILITSVAQGREWHDASGTYHIEADLFAFDDDNVVLQRADHELGLLRIDELSPEDRQYLESADAEAISRRNTGDKQTWTTRSGLKLVGRVVDYVRGEVLVQRRRGRMYVNDRRFANLPELYQKLFSKIIEHYDEVEIPNEEALQKWLRSLRGQPRTFLLEGVKLEMENGDEYAIPFFVFADDDRRLLKAGWSEWLNMQADHDNYDDAAFRLQALAAAHLRNQELQRQIALIDLKLQTIRAGLTSAWEVTLYPAPGNPSPPRWVVMPARNSAEATTAALHKNPGFMAGPVRRISR